VLPKAPQVLGIQPKTDIDQNFLIFVIFNYTLIIEESELLSFPGIGHLLGIVTSFVVVSGIVCELVRAAI
jgi:hypothetical protein